MSIVGTQRNGLAAGRTKSDLIMLTQLVPSTSSCFLVHLMIRVMNVKSRVRDIGLSEEGYRLSLAFSFAVARMDMQGESFG